MTHIVWWGWDPKPNDSMEIYGITMYRDFFPEGPDFTHHYDIRALPKGVGAVLVINSCISEQTSAAYGWVAPGKWGADRTQVLTVLQEYITQMPWVIILVAQDEDAHVPFDTLAHPKMRIWVQVPKPALTPTHRGLAWAARCENVRRLPPGWDGMFHSLASPSFRPNFTSRPIDWMFKGACAFHRHGEWLQALQNLANHPQPLPIEEHANDASHLMFIQYEGKSAECKASGRLSVEDYIQMHTSSKVIICRPESWNPAPARVFFVLQAGCVPIVSEKPSIRGSAWYDNYDWSDWWEYMLGEKPPFPVVRDVNDLGRILEQAIKEWPENGKRVYAWWTDYKARLGASLRAEIREIQR